MIKLTDVIKNYKLPGGGCVKALDGVSITFPDTGLVSVLGRNGCGKTTLLNLLGGIDKPDGGKIEYNGQDLSCYSASAQDSYRNRDIGFIFQDYNLIAEYTVEENVRLAVRLQDGNEARVGEKTRAALESVGLADYAGRKITALSGGQRQRVVLARALAKDSKVLLCDEPTGNLDSQSAEAFFTLLHKLSADRLVITVTHDREIAEEFSDAIVYMKDGRIERTAGDILNACAESAAPVLKKRKRGNGFSLRNTLRYACRNIKGGILISVTVLLVISIAFTLLLSFFSLSEFNRFIAMNNTVKANGATVISLSKYVDHMVENGYGGWFYGVSYDAYASKETDIDEIKELLGDDAVLYKSYVFTEYLDYLTDENDEYLTTNFRANCFNEFVAVDDFSTFHQTLLCGKYPESGNEILIYDYMAENMLGHGGFDGASAIEDFVGYTITDKYTGTSFLITGILKSNYEAYRYLDEEEGDYDFETSYLASLQSVYGLTSFLESIKGDFTREDVFRSWFETQYYTEQGEFQLEVLTEKESKPLTIIDSSAIKWLNFRGNLITDDVDRGVVISRGHLAKILNMEKKDLTDEYILELLQSQKLVFVMTTSSVDGDINKGLLHEYQTAVAGIFEGDSDEIYRFYADVSDSTEKPSMTFRKFYLSLSGDDAENLEFISKLMPEGKTKDFYVENPDYSVEGYAIYTPYLEIVNDALTYLSGIGDMGWLLFIICLGLVAVAVIAYGSLAIKKRKFEIGLFKSLGVSNGAIATIFGIEVLLIVGVSVLCSLFLSPLLVKTINAAFTSDLQFPVTFFRVYASDMLIPIAVGLVTVLIALLIPIVRLLRMQPAVIMRNSRK